MDALVNDSLGHECTVLLETRSVSEGTPRVMIDRCMSAKFDGRLAISILKN